MRSNICRAKRVDNGEWVEGYHVKLENMNIIVPMTAYLDEYAVLSDYYQVIPETVGRLLEYPCWDGDYSGRRFFQNDIIAVYHKHDDVDAVVDPWFIALVIDEHSISENGLGRCFPQDTTRVKIIGNAYDTPWFIEGTHTMNHFINGLHEYPGSCEEYSKEHQYLIDKYNIHGAHACCYMCNFENDYICHQYNGGCSKLGICRRICRKESEE